MREHNMKKFKCDLQKVFAHKFNVRVGVGNGSIQ
jgi:hypothetical protein